MAMGRGMPFRKPSISEPEKPPSLEPRLPQPAEIKEETEAPPQRVNRARRVRRRILRPTT